MKVTTFGLDLAKSVFQLHWVDTATGEVCRRRLRREQVLPFFVKREPAGGGVEGRGRGAHLGGGGRGLGGAGERILAPVVGAGVAANKNAHAGGRGGWGAGARPRNGVGGAEEPGHREQRGLP